MIFHPSTYVSFGPPPGAGRWDTYSGPRRLWSVACMREVSERADEPMPKTGGFVSEKEYSTHVLGVCGSENMLYSNEPSRVANFNASGHVYLNNHHVMSIQNKVPHPFTKSPVHFRRLPGAAIACICRLSHGTAVATCGGGSH